MLCRKDELGFEATYLPTRGHGVLPIRAVRCERSPLLYGEGAQKVFFRLQHQFIQQSDDESIFARTNMYDPHPPTSEILASSPSDFWDAGQFRILSRTEEGYTSRAPYAITNRGLSFETEAYELRREDYRSDPSVQNQSIPRIVIHRELPPGPMYAIPLNCKQSFLKAQHRGRVLCHLQYKGQLTAEALGPEDRCSVAFLGERCFIFLREYEAGVAIVEDYDYFGDPDSSMSLGFIGERGGPKCLFIKL